jgi:hypothetical protein
MEPPMSTRFAVLTALLAAVAGLTLHARPPRKLRLQARRLGRSAAKTVSDDWDALFI